MIKKFTKSRKRKTESTEGREADSRPMVESDEKDTSWQLVTPGQEVEAESSVGQDQQSVKKRPHEDQVKAIKAQIQSTKSFRIEMHWSEWPYRATIRRKFGNKSVWKWYHTKLDILVQIANWAASW